MSYRVLGGDEKLGMIRSYLVGEFVKRGKVREKEKEKVFEEKRGCGGLRWKCLCNGERGFGLSGLSIVCKGLLIKGFILLGRV